MTCGVWVGYDDRQSLGEKETGARAALPIWMQFMKVAIVGKENRGLRGGRGEESSRLCDQRIYRACNASRKVHTAGCKCNSGSRKAHLPPPAADSCTLANSEGSSRYWPIKV